MTVAPAGPAISRMSPRAKLPPTAVAPAASRLARRSARAAPPSTAIRPRGEPARQPCLARAAPLFGDEQGVPRPSAVDSGRSMRPEAMARCAPAALCDARGGDFRDHAARSHARGRARRPSRDRASISRDHARYASRRILRDDCGRTARRYRRAGSRPARCAACATRAARRSLSPKRISSVATLSFSLITGTTPSAEQPVERRGGVEITAAILEIVERHQHLRGGEPLAPSNRPRHATGDLPGRGGRLRILQAGAPALGEPSRRAPSAIAPDETIATCCPARVTFGDVGDNPDKPVTPNRAIRIDEQRRADLDDQARTGPGRSPRADGRALPRCPRRRRPTWA
jgi:hypothetical protein